MNECRHKRTGRILAATIADYANRREVEKMVGNISEMREWEFAIGNIREQMAANVSNHKKTCQR